LEERYAFGAPCSEAAMRRFVKIFAYIAAGLLAAILLVAAIFVLRPAYTPPISSTPGHVSVASLEKIKLGGVDQYILIRGRSVSNPVLLFLHGGPGMPMMYLAHKFQHPLEETFTVVQWDRRGAGKSYNPNIPADTIRVSQEVSDTRDLVNLLRKRFHQQRIYLVGHSYGSYLGMLVIKRYPRLFKAYVGIGQMACSDRQSRAIQDNWIREQAVASNNAEALNAVNGARLYDREQWLFQFGGELRGATSFIPLILTGLGAPEYTFTDAMNVRKGVSFTHKHLKYDVIQGALIDSVTSVDIPVYFFTGRFDETDPYQCTARYFELLHAPKKMLIWFDHSAHFPFLEEPNGFANELEKIAR
jgi:pimeloyl-ACP methyl ester carboxylesterase